MNRVLWILVVVLSALAAALAQGASGQLRLHVIDPQRAPVKTDVLLENSAASFRATTQTHSDGRVEVKSLPLGQYRVSIAVSGFKPVAAVLQIRSSIPVSKTVQLEVAPVSTSVEVREPSLLVDPQKAGTEAHVGEADMKSQAVAAPGRSLVQAVASQPGWILEANGVLHPRGSEYQVQYVVDGIPFTDNRSPAYAPGVDGDSVSAVTVITGSYPAELGRKLGGVVEVESRQDLREGVHGQFDISRASFRASDAYADVQDSWRHASIGFNASHSATDRYLDPPVLQNFTNHGAATSGGLRANRDLTSRDQLSGSVRFADHGFGIPNELIQQRAGQMQRSGSREFAAISSYQHIFSENVLFNLRGMARKVSFAIASNAASTPIIVGQDRSLREQYVNSSLSIHHASNEWKFGGEGDFGSVNEQFSYQLSDPTRFDPGTPASFAFRGHALDREASAYAQDSVTFGRWTLSAGLRFDHYDFLVNRNALSPRIGIGRYFAPLNLMVHASYDRVFQTPAYENLLLSSSSAVAALDPKTLRLPVPPSTGNFYEVGITKSLASKARLDLNYYRREISNFADDDTLLDTGISFPIAFRHASIYGAEAKLSIPRWRRLSGWVSYSYLMGTATLPVTGGYFYGGDVGGLLNSTDRFAISQDQRNTASTRFRYEIGKRLWLAAGGSYYSGLPVEFDGTQAEAVAQYGPAIVSQVNFARGRVRPSYSVDSSVGVTLLTGEHHNLSLQFDGTNLTNHLNIINFAGLFSGTAIGMPRSGAARLRFQF